MEFYTLAELQAMPTITVGHTDDLKVKTDRRKVWLSRLTIEDGQPYNNMVTVEVRSNKGWFPTMCYEAK
jgi:hypothetical protein